MNKQEQHDHSIDVPTPILIGGAGAFIWTFFVVTYLLVVILDPLRG